MPNTISSVALIDLPYFRRDGGELVVMETGVIPFSIERVFNVCAEIDAIRGNHAHRKCIQFLTCVSGGVEVLWYEGTKTFTFVLDSPRQGLLVPAGIWARQTYKQENTVLTVLCDRGYEEEDYIRDYTEFSAYRKKLSAHV